MARVGKYLFRLQRGYSLSRGARQMVLHYSDEVKEKWGFADGTVCFFNRW